MSTTAEASTPACPVSDADPFSAGFFDDPFPIHAQLRDAGAVVWLRRYGTYAVARHEEVYTVLRDWQTFCSSRGVGLSDFKKEKPWRLPSLLLETDPPLHDRTRTVVARILSPAAMRSLREGFAAAADRMVDELLERRSFDAVPNLAETFPLRVFPDAVGLPPEGRENLLPYSNMVFNSFGPRNEFFEEAVENAAPVLEWVQRQSRREHLLPGGFGAQIHDAVATGEISTDEAPILVRSLLTAGVDTTVSGIGAAIYCLARFPEEWRKLRENPSLARNAFEEAVRYETPVQTFFRTTARPVEIGGTPIDEGAKVLMFLGAANRDPRKWPDPDRYDMSRKLVGQVGFGAGVHVCVGASLARLEGEVLLEALARKVSIIDITGPISRRYNNTLRGLASLPVTLRAA
jgi:4-methoxybenzoate monooxygenase (O-demethylating)